MVFCAPGSVLGNGFVQVQEDAGDQRPRGKFRPVELFVDRGFADLQKVRRAVGMGAVLSTVLFQGALQEFKLVAYRGSSRGEAESRGETRGVRLWRTVEKPLRELAR